MKRENNRVKSQIIMQEQKPQERFVQLKEHRTEQDHFVVMNLILTNSYLLPMVSAHLIVGEDHRRIA